MGGLAATGLAVVLALQLAKPDVPAEASADPSASPGTPETVAAVETVRARQGRWNADPGSWRVTISWEAVDAAAGYLVVRNGRGQGEVEGTEFVDRSVVPDERYRYEVVVVDADGNRSRPARTRIRTEPLPNADARVEGRWVLRLRVQSTSIGVGNAQIPVAFDPVCRAGPCAVRWRFVEVGNTGTAKRSGHGYEGSGSGSFLTRDCHGGTIGSTGVRISFEVTTSHTVDRTWTATEISGTLTESAPSVSDCLSARNVWTFEGSAQG